MIKKTIVKGNTKEGRDQNYTFEAIEESGKLTAKDFYHVRLWRNEMHMVGKHPETKEVPTTKMVSPRQYRRAYKDEKHSQWTQLYKRIDLLFNPDIEFEEENNHDVFFENKSQVSQAKKETLIEFCKQNLPEETYKNCKTIGEYKEVVLKNVNFD